MLTPAAACREALRPTQAWLRALMLEAATRHHQDPARLSLAGAAAAVRQWAPPLMALRSRRQKCAHLDAFFRILAYDLVPHRPDRVEPRARKRRAKNYQLLNKPRTLFKEILHHSHYKARLT